jgi:stress-induced-phosphoprotein 1
MTAACLLAAVTVCSTIDRSIDAIDHPQCCCRQHPIHPFSPTTKHNRNRGIFAAGNFPIAEILYDKAIKVKPDAVLYANRSAARLNLNMADAALEDADRAIGLDAEYSKAYYRKGQAHNARKEYAEALAAFEKGLSVDPTNKTFAEQIAKAKAAAAKVCMRERM